MPTYVVDEQNTKIAAGWLIEQCGWKGKNIGPAGVYEKQALVLVNLGGAKGADIENLSNAIIASVKERFNITLSPEVYIY
jgi:UDP-N-acetylmuramate dehydrogenase